MFRAVAPSIFIDATYPFSKAGTTLTASVDNVVSSFGDVNSLVREKNNLLKQNDELFRENKNLNARVDDLTKIIGTTTPTIHGIVAGVVSRPPESPYDTIVISASKKLEVSKGDFVLANDGTPVGKVSSVSTHTARVSLLSSPNATTTAWVGSGRIPVTLVGNGAGMFMVNVPRQINIAVGDSVFVAGPKMVRIIGVVLKKDSDPAATMVTLRVRPVVNIFSLTTVEVVPK